MECYLARGHIIFQIIERDDEFAGIFLNSGSDTSYPIPRELFEEVKTILRRPADE